LRSQAARQSDAAVALSAVAMLGTGVQALAGVAMTSYGAGATNASRQSPLLAAPTMLVWCRAGYVNHRVRKLLAQAGVAATSILAHGS
jgi:hypothetical protein